MAISLSFNDKKTYLQVIFDGHFIRGDIDNMWKELHAYLSQSEHKLVLVEEAPTATADILDTMEIYAIAKFFARSSLGRKIRVALLYNENVSQETLKQAHFGETVARNRGFRLRVFNQKDEAKKWLFRKSA